MGKKKEKYRYIFGSGFARAMNKVSMRGQLEASMLSQFMLIIGLTIMAVFNLLFGKTSLWLKIIVTFNLIAGWILISSYLVTTFQQYKSHMEVMQYDPDEERKKIKKRGNIFKRISLARRNKRIAKHSPAPKLVTDALDKIKTNTNKIPSDEELENILIQLEGSNKK